MNNETITDTTYEVQNWIEGPWVPVNFFPTQEHAEEYLHRTNAYEGLPALVTVDNPQWRIIKVETVERVTVVARVSAVLQGDRYVMASEA